MRMSPVQSRARTPSFTENGEEYFGLQMHGRSLADNQSSKRRKSLGGSAIGLDKKKSVVQSADRRKSSSGSSTSSLNSSGKLSRGTIK
jgi:20S proteasome alpha/beta subunit